MNEERFNQPFGTKDRMKRGEATSKNMPQVTNYIMIDKRKIINKYYGRSPTGTDIQLEKGGNIMNEIQKRKFSTTPRLKIDQRLLTLVKNRARTGSRVSIKRMREITSKIKGSMSEAVVEERNHERW